METTRCFVCSSSAAPIVCEDCGIARYCSADCQSHAQEAWSHRERFCAMSCAKLGVKIYYESPDGGFGSIEGGHAPYKWFRDYLVAHVPALEEAPPITSPKTSDELFKFYKNIAAYSLEFMLKEARIEDARETSPFDKNVSDFVNHVVNGCSIILIQRDYGVPDDYSPSLLLEQLWYALNSKFDLEKAYGDKRSRERDAKKRKLEDQELDAAKYEGELRAYKRQRLADQERAMDKMRRRYLPYIPTELFLLVAQFLPARDALRLTLATRQDIRDVSLPFVVKMLIERDFLVPLREMKRALKTDEDKAKSEALVQKVFQEDALVQFPEIDATRDKDRAAWLKWRVEQLTFDAPLLLVRANGALYMDRVPLRYSHDTARLNGKKPTLALYYDLVADTMLRPVYVKTGYVRAIFLGSAGLRFEIGPDDEEDGQQIHYDSQGLDSPDLVARAILCNRSLRENKGRLITQYDALHTFISHLLVSDPLLTGYYRLDHIDKAYRNVTLKHEIKSSLFEGKREKYFNVAVSSLRYGLRYGLLYDSVVAKPRETRNEILLKHEPFTFANLFWTPSYI